MIGVHITLLAKSSWRMVAGEDDQQQIGRELHAAELALRRSAQPAAMSATTSPVLAPELEQQPLQQPVT